MLLTNSRACLRAVTEEEISRADMTNLNCCLQTYTTALRAVCAKGSSQVQDDKPDLLLRNPHQLSTGCD